MASDSIIPSADSDLDPAELAAAEWLLRREQGLSAEDERSFAAWLAADPRHARLFAKQEQTWAILGAVPARDYPAAVPPRGGLLRWGWVAAGLAAALALGFVLWPAGPAPHSQVAATDTAGFRRLDLPDGSTVTLNAASEVEVAYTARERGVRLRRGEASFAVARDPARPFVVAAGGVAVRAVGTAFNVRLQAATVEVLVTEGRVRVDDAARGQSLLQAAATAQPGTEILEAGQKVVIALDAGTALPAPAPVAAVSPDELGRATAWPARNLYFSGETLAEVVAEFNRHNRHRLVIADPRLAAQRFGGKFPADDHAGFVRALEANFGVEAERRADETLLRLVP